MKPDWFDKRPLILLIVFTVLFFWRLALSDQFTFLDSPDLTYQVLPWYQVQARSWHNGEFPLWDPYQWVGQSLIGQMQPGAAFPLNWPLFLAPLDDGYINLRYIHWHFVLMHLLAGLFMYALARELGRSRYASLVAALAFSCSGYVGTQCCPGKVAPSDGKSRPLNVLWPVLPGNDLKSRGRKWSPERSIRTRHNEG